MKDFLGGVGRTSFFVLAGTSRLAGLSAEVMKAILAAIFRRGSIRREALFHQMVLAGVDSIGIIALVSAAVGAVLALQAAYQLKDFGAVMYTGALVSVSVTRELGPLVAAVVIAGRIGARFAAELGTMKVQEEIDALTTMGLNPIAFLVVPRCLALMIMLPCLTIVTDVVAMVGGYLVGTLSVGINPYLYVMNSIEAMVLKDLYSGFIKSIIFSAIIALVSCHQGLSVEGGAQGVGKATTEAVVISIVLIIVVDCIATAVIYYAFS
ncbi:MAG: ABC transporter permease [Candidatus Omnitrophota bacterium]|nr:ABC transporter permease [Candidatus Omnitrophota bacterium]